MKKVLAAALLCAVSTFASWDKFPVIEYGKGQAKIEWATGRQGNNGWGTETHFYGIRYSLLENLELAALANDNYTLGARYQIVPVLSAGVDVGFPLPGTAWSFTPNVQFSTEITSTLSLGSNVEATISTEDAGKNTDGIDLAAGVELDLAFSEKSTIWVSFDIDKKLTEDKQNGQKVTDSNKGLLLNPSVGYLIILGNLELGTFVGFEFGGKDVDRDPFATVVGMDAAVKF